MTLRDREGGGARSGLAGMSGDRAVPAIELIDVTKRYGEAVALDGVSLQIEAGEFFCLLGPSGCGKTTTLNLIGGFVPLTSGELRIEGRRVNDLPPHQRNVNTVFQNYALFPHMTVAENVAFGLRMESLPSHEIGRRVGEYLELVDLAGYGDRHPGPAVGRPGPAGRARPRAVPSDRRCCCSTSRSGRSISSCASRCRSSWRASTARSARPSCSSPTTRRRRCPCRRGSRSWPAGESARSGRPREIYLRPVDRFVADFIGESNFLDGELTERRRRTGLPPARRNRAAGPRRRRRLRPRAAASR